MAVNYFYDTLRVQGSDDDLIAALDNMAAAGWEVMQLIPTGFGVSTSATADGSWFVLLRKKG